MMRTRRLHARLAYVMRVDNRASVAYSAASTSARTPRPPRVAYAEASCRPRPCGKKHFCGRAAHRTLGLRYALFARRAGSHDAHKATARTLMRKLGKSLRRAPTPCDNHIHIQRESSRASNALTCSVETRCVATRDIKEWQQKTRRMAANSARVSSPMHLLCTVKLRSSALYRQVK
jgi:hypothetical protein